MPTATLTVKEDEAAQYLLPLKRKLALGETTTSYDSELIDRLREALDLVGKYCGLCLQPTTVIATALQDGDALPLGPLHLEDAPVTITAQPGPFGGSTVTLTDATASQLSDGPFPVFYARQGEGVNHTVTYTAGYSKTSSPLLPSGLVGAVIEHAAAHFQGGGVSNGPVRSTWKTLAAPYRRFDR